MSFFDAIANEYDYWYQTPLGAFVDEVENKLTFDTIGLRSGTKVLDVGCGSGIYTKRLVEKGCLVTGVDISGKMLELAQEKLPDVCFVQSSVYRLPFPENKFDMAFSMATFEFVEEFEAAFFEMKRVVKPGGQIFIGTINGDSAWGEHYQTETATKTTVFKHAFFKTPEDLKRIDEKNLVAYRNCLFYPPDTLEGNLTWEYEKQCAITEKPGFIAGLWKKEV